jgi:hypothetical protein
MSASATRANATYPTPSSSDPAAMAGLQFLGSGDFNGDGHGDLALVDADDTTLQVWLLDATGNVQGAPLTQPVPMGTRPAGIGDFDGDGIPDVLYQGLTTGEILVSFGNGAASGNMVRSQQVVQASVPSSWHILGIGDFDGDGTSDILWQSTTGSTAGEVSIWQMKSGSIAAYLSPQGQGVNNDMSWVCQGVGDFNGDGTSDVLWANSMTGLMSIWQMGSGKLLQARTLQGPNGSGPGPWAVEAIGDFNGDGTSDILWVDTSPEPNGGGDVSIWTMGTELQILSHVDNGDIALVWTAVGSAAQRLVAQ